MNSFYFTTISVNDNERKFETSLNINIFNLNQLKINYLCINE